MIYGIDERSSCAWQSSPLGFFIKDLRNLAEGPERKEQR